MGVGACWLVASVAYASEGGGGVGAACLRWCLSVSEHFKMLNVDIGSLGSSAGAHFGPPTLHIDGVCERQAILPCVCLP